MEFAMEKYTIIPSLVQVDEDLGQKLPQVRKSNSPFSKAHFHMKEFREKKTGQIASPPVLVGLSGGRRPPSLAAKPPASRRD